MILLFFSFYFIFSVEFNNIIIIIVTKLGMATDTSLDWFMFLKNTKKWLIRSNPIKTSNRPMTLSTHDRRCVKTHWFKKKKGQNEVGKIGEHR